MSNIACRIFKEQIDLLLSLPSQEEAKKVLYYAVINSLNQFENHFDNQIENQNENAYVSVSESLSELSKSILNLLSKNIVWKEFSNNYGGKREGAGAPKKPQEKPKEKPLGLPSENLSENENKDKKFKKPTIEEINKYCLDRNNNINAEQFFDFYESKGWKVGNQPMKDWKASVRTWEKKEREKRTWRAAQGMFGVESGTYGKDIPL